VELRDGRLEDVDGMARVWAAATAARDGRSTPASLAEAREPILAAMTDHGATAVVAVGQDVVAFAVATTRAPPDAREAEVRFVGVAPPRWREGVGERVLASLVARLRQRGYDAAGLLVYVDNPAAIALYERGGWTASANSPTVHPRSGRLEQRYRLELAKARQDGVPQPAVERRSAPVPDDGPA
jgi:ribosomal protein S18 acetylase RimI-like enzyme